MQSCSVQVQTAEEELTTALQLWCVLLQCLLCFGHSNSLKDMVCQEIISVLQKQKHLYIMWNQVVR